MRVHAQWGGWVLRGQLATPSEWIRHYRSWSEPSSGRFFLTFGGTGCAPDQCIGPLGKIYLHNEIDLSSSHLDLGLQGHMA